MMPRLVLPPAILAVSNVEDSKPPAKKGGKKKQTTTQSEDTDRSHSVKNSNPREVFPYAAAMPCSVEVPVTATSKCDCFIDDIIQVFLDTPDNRAKQPHVVPLAVHVSCRPHADKEEPIKRRPLLSQEKVEAEGAPAELQIVLGWSLNTRVLLLSLPLDKFLAWTDDIRSTLKKSRTSFEDLESLIGRLNHAAFVIPLSRHFINIRPQVLEWTNNMSYDMTHYESFLDLSSQPEHRNSSRQFPTNIIPPFHGRDSSIIIPKLHLIH